jgi:predicted kinase
MDLAGYLDKGSAMKLMILRGIRNSGKSTWARQMATDWEANAAQQGQAFIASSDFLFHSDQPLKPIHLAYKHNKPYVQVNDPVTVLRARATVFNAVATFVTGQFCNKQDLLVIDACNIHLEEFSPYFLLGLAFSLEPMIVQFMDSPDTCSRRDGKPLNMDAMIRDHYTLRTMRLPGSMQEVVKDPKQVWSPACGK